MKKSLLSITLILALTLTSCGNKTVDDVSSTETSETVTSQTSSAVSSEETVDKPKPYYDMLYSIAVDGKCGYIDIDGKIVVEPQYDSAGDFSEGLAEVSKNELSSYIDLSGEVIFKLNEDFRHASSFDGDLASVDSWRYINKKGEVVIDILDQKHEDLYGTVRYPNTLKIANGTYDYPYAESFNDNRASIGYTVNGRIDGAGYTTVVYSFFIDTNGDAGFINQGSVHAARGFSDGYALIDCNGYQMFIDTDYNIKMIFYNTPEDYYGPFGFAEGYTSISSGFKKLEGEDVSKSRNQIKENFSQYYNERDIKEFYFTGEETERTSQYLNKNGELFGNYDFAGDFDKGLAIVKIDEQYSCIDTKGDIVFTSEHLLSCHSDRMIAYYLDDGATIHDYDKVGFMNEKGEIVIPAEYDRVLEQFSNGLAYMVKGDKEMYINKSGEVVWEKEREDED